MSYDEIYAAASADAGAFWLEQSKLIDWITPPKVALSDADRPSYRWFPDGVMNTCYNALDRHVSAGRGEQTALVYDSPVTGAKRSISYREALDECSKIAGGLARLGVEKGDRVLIYMPMVPEAVLLMLACARLGAIHTVVFGGFSGQELATRIDDCTPKVIVGATCGIEPARVVDYTSMIDSAYEVADHQPEHLVLFHREQQPEATATPSVSWGEFLDGAPIADCVPVSALDPLYILYTSGTTGQPKGVVRDNGGHAVAMCWSMKAVYDIDVGDTFWAASDIGWVVGHSYIVYAPLLRGATSIIYEGKPVGTPDPGAFWRVVSENNVKALFTAPTAIRAIKQQDSPGLFAAAYDLSCLEALFLAGERCDPPTAEWAHGLLNVPVIDNWWQTETGWAISSNFKGLGLFDAPIGSVGKASPGWQMEILDDEGQPVPPGTLGNVVGKLPMPPSSFPTLWGNHQRWIESYMSAFPGYYQTGDAGVIDADGMIHIMGRTDDVINVAGHRLSTGALEEVVASIDSVAECAVVGVADRLKGQLPTALMVLKAGTEKPSEAVSAEAVALVRDKIGPVAAFKNAIVVARLPKTRSGKILRATMRAIAEDRPYKMPATIDDPAILDEIKTALKKN